MRSAKPHERVLSRSSFETLGARVVLIASAAAFLQGCFVFQGPARPDHSRTQAQQRPSSAPAATTAPAVEEEVLPPEGEIEGPPLPPPAEDIVGPPAPASTPSEVAGADAAVMPQQQAYASPRTEALLQGFARKGIAAQACDRGVVIILPESVFEYGTADLPRASKRRLHDIADVVLEQASGTPVAVEGHTDSIGADMFNQGLSRRRARAVANELEAGGIARDLVTSRGFGSQFPIAPNEHPDGSDDPDGRARNRRVEVVIETEHAPHG